MEFSAITAYEQQEFDRLVASFEVHQEHVLGTTTLRPAAYSG
ncbi:hypothetical protein [Corynebacterium hindlerae]|nr:hypothetical protein [Corynebacterium hindlerae]